MVAICSYVYVSFVPVGYLPTRHHPHASRRYLPVSRRPYSFQHSPPNLRTISRPCAASCAIFSHLNISTRHTGLHILKRVEGGHQAVQISRCPPPSREPKQGRFSGRSFTEGGTTRPCTSRLCGHLATGALHGVFEYRERRDGYDLFGNMRPTKIYPAA